MKRTPESPAPPVLIFSVDAIPPRVFLIRGSIVEILGGEFAGFLDLEECKTLATCIRTAEDFYYLSERIKQVVRKAMAVKNRPLVLH